jgi:DTW domain-containing protein YfiP
MQPPPRPARPYCERCWRPQSTCLCAWRRPTANEVEVLLLQHPAETRHAKGSARLLQLSLQNCLDQVGEAFDAAALMAWLQAPGPDGRPRQPWLLFPAAPGTSAEPPPAAQDLRLVVLDGSWRQARQLLARHPALQQLPRWSLASPPPSRYTIRKAQRPDQRSTLEATCLALAALEGNGPRYEPLLAAFEGWVAAEDQRRSLTA